jgi:hypothetical protein
MAEETPVDAPPECHMSLAFVLIILGESMRLICAGLVGTDSCSLENKNRNESRRGMYTGIPLDFRA